MFHAELLIHRFRRLSRYYLPELQGRHGLL